MRLGEILVARGIVTIADIDAALQRQRSQGGRLGENLIALGRMTEDQLALVINSAPASPASVAETGIAQRNLLQLLLKFVHIEACETAQELEERMKLPRRVVQQLLDEATQQRYIQALGAIPGNAFAIRYAISDSGRVAAREALDQSLYIGPAPVSLTAYQEQVENQRIANESLGADDLRQGFRGLVVPEHYIRKLLPAINAGRSVLLFGPPGNGKTTLATRISMLFRDPVCIPYAVEVGGQIIKVFDPRLHKPLVSDATAAALSGTGLQREGFDERWVACSRPAAFAGGELTLDMLDLQFNSDTKFYDAPLHMKALNGMLLIDDFGRQKFRPEEYLLNRWIVPMENQICHMTLNTGASFTVPFDVLVMFSTNLQPSDLMDPAFLRRIQYKIKLFSPSREEYLQIFDAVARSRGLELDRDVVDYVIQRLDYPFGLAYYQPRFICDQAVQACQCFGLPPVLTKDLAAEALANLYFDIEDARDAATTPS